MNSGFDKLKRNRSSNIDKLVGEVLDTQKDSREVLYNKLPKRLRIENSLMWSDDSDCHTIRGKMERCRSFQRIQRGITKGYQKYIPQIDPFKEVKGYIGKYVNRKEVCQSLWCPNCRKFLTQLYERTIQQRLDERLLPSEYTNDDFHHISGVIGLCDVDDKEVTKLLKDDELRWRRVRNRVNNKIQPKDSPFIESVYEFELVDWTFLKNSEQIDFKSKQIKQLIEHQRYKGSKFLFVHFHSITNLTKDQINKVFEDEYFVGGKPLLKTNKDCGLYVQKFHSTQTLENNLSKLCSYPFKDPYRFKHSFRGSDYQNGEYFENDDLSQLIKVYHKIQKRNWRGLFRSVTHKRSVEFHKMRKWFPSDHPIWFGQWYRFRNTDQRRSKLDTIRLEKVWIVDSDGNTHIEGWDPNSFFLSGLELDIIQRHKKWIGKEEVVLMDKWGDEVFDINDNPIMIMRNKYHYFDDTTVTKKMRLEEFYYPKEHKLLKKDQYLIVDDKNRRHRRDWVRLQNKDIDRLLTKVGIKDGSRIPLDFEFSIEDENFIRRMETLVRLDSTDRFMLSLWNYNKLRHTMDRKQIHILF